MALVMADSEAVTLASYLPVESDEYDTRRSFPCIGIKVE
jgi:hypothetical protein